MAHFAKLGVDNIVETVEVLSNDVATSEQAGVDFLNKLYGTEDVWKQTSYNKTIRKNFAGIGFTYDETRDAFIPPKPYPSWILDEAYTSLYFTLPLCAKFLVNARYCNFLSSSTNISTSTKLYCINF